MPTRTAVSHPCLLQPASSLAQGVFQHPAVSTPPQVAAWPFDFPVGIRQPQLQVRHANADHPRCDAREAAPRFIDPNTFIVQPPHMAVAHPGAVAPQETVAAVHIK